jgi:hypothetical protein
MSQKQLVRWWVGAILLCLLVGPAGRGAAEDKRPAFPEGSEKAVAAVKKAFADAAIDEVAEPKGFGGSGGKGTPMFWSVRFHVGDKKHELSVLPDGTIMRLPTPAEVKDLPRPVADAVAKAAPGATVRGAEKQEMRATLKYVALDKPQVMQYAIDVAKDGKRSRVTTDGEGGNAKVTELKEPPAGPKDKGDKPAEKEKEKDIDIPEKAAKAVKAIKAVHPDAVVKEITTEVFDDGTGDIEILTYEVEFLSGGAKHEMVASPEGVIPHLWTAVEAKALPKPVAAALDKAVPGAKVEKARALEIRASLRFGPLAKPKVYYTVNVEKGDEKKAIKVKPDGTLIKDPTFPKKGDK